MKKEKIIIGSRGSKLALIYAEKVNSELEKEFSNKIEIKKIVTSGDENQKDRLSNLGGKGLFSSKIERTPPNSSFDLISEKLAIVPSEGLPPNILKLRCRMLHCQITKLLHPIRVIFFL